MKKILTILLSLFTVASFGQTTVIYNTLKNDGYTFGGKDTVVKYALENAVNKYFTGYGTWGSLPDTVRTFFNVDTSRTSGGATYNPATGVFSIPKITGGGGSSSTVQQDSSFLVATSHSNGLAVVNAGRKGILIRDTSGLASQSSPALAWQGGNPSGGKMFWRVYIVGVNRNLSFDFSPDSVNWTNALLLAYNGSLSTPSISVTGSAASGITGTTWFLSNAGLGGFGTTSVNNSVAWDFRPRNSGNYGLSIPSLSTTNRNNYPTILIIGTSSGTITNGGSGYTNGTYNIKNFTNVSSSGSGATATFTVSGGAITSVSVTGVGTGGYKAGDVLSVAASDVGGTGSGFQYTLTKTTGDQNNGTLVYDSTSAKPVWWDSHAHVNRPIIDSVTISGNLTTSSASTLTLTAGNDYVFTGTTATYALPAISTTAIGRQNRIYIRNRGTGTITLNAASGSTIYTTSAVSTINIIAGAACELLPDGNYFNVMYNQ
jgi:hypothetical protein